MCAAHTCHGNAPTRIPPPPSSQLTPPLLYCRPVFHLRFPCAGFPRTWHAIRKKAFVPCASALHDRYVRLLNYLLMPACRREGCGEGGAGGVTSQVQRRNITECVYPLPLSLWIRIQIEATNLNWPPEKWLLPCPALLLSLCSRQKTGRKQELATCLCTHCPRAAFSVVLWRTVCASYIMQHWSQANSLSTPSAE